MVGAKRVGMLAPMVHELEPLVRELELEDQGGHHLGKADHVEIVAMVTNMGIAAGGAAARRILEHDVDHVMVVGIAGGVDHSLSIGALVVPEAVLDRATGRTFTPARVGDVEPRGIVSCGDDLITDAVTIAQWEADGVVAVEMETTGVAPVCEDAGVAWSVYRGISDFADGGLVDDGVFEMANPDGTSDPEALQRYLAENPERAKVLAQLAHDMRLATDVAAAAAIRACAAV
jgi:nucleoside phosphorylase